MNWIKYGKISAIILLIIGAAAILAKNLNSAILETCRLYIYEILATGALFIILFGIITVIAKRLKNAQINLIKNHQELIKLNNELASSEEVLRKKYNELVNVKESLQTSEEKFRLAVEATNDAIVDLNLINMSFKFSERWTDLTGYTPFELENMYPWSDIIYEEDQILFHRLFSGDFEKISEKDQFQYRIKTKDGKWKWLLFSRTVLFDETGKPIRLVSAHTDIDYIKKTQEELEYEFYHNYVTGLPNRRALVKHLEALTANASEMSFALIFVDIVNFKLINNSIGHKYGDLLLKDIGSKIRSALHSKAELFALYGANFVILQNFESKNDIEETIETLKTKFKNSFESNSMSFNVNFSIGVATYPSNGQSVEELLKNSDIALYEAKRKGKGQCVYFSDIMKTHLMERMVIERGIQEALARNQLTLHYQPQLNLKQGKVNMVEALLRLKSPELSDIPIYQVIKLAEENHLIIPIGEWVLDQACSMLAKLHSLGFSDTGVSINVSLLQLMQENFVALIDSALSKYNLSRKFLELEITETMFMESLELLNDRLIKMSESGMRITLDDFGKGYSSLTYLKQMPIVKLKIDKSFLNGKGINKNDKVMVDYIIKIGQNMGMQVLVEGVESYEQYESLRNADCDEIQGYLFAKPIPEERLINFLRKVKDMNIDQISKQLKDYGGINEN